MSQLTVALIGCGYFGEKHLAVLLSLPYIKVKLICDVDVERAKHIANRYKVEHWTQNYADVLEDNDITAVIIATHENTHAELSIEAMRHGKHVLVEKPMASTYKQVEEMIMVSRETNRILMPGHLLRFDHRYAIVHERKQQMGNIHSIFAKRNSPRHVRDFYNGIHPVMMTMIHDLDLILWYVDSPVTKVYALQKSTQNNKQIDHVLAILQFANGATACLQTSWLLPEREGIVPESSMEILTESGRFIINSPSDEIVIQSDEEMEVTDVSMWPLLHGVQSGAIRNEIEHFLFCVMNEVCSSICPPEISLLSSEIADVILQSALSGKEISL